MTGRMQVLLNTKRIKNRFQKKSTWSWYYQTSYLRSTTMIHESLNNLAIGNTYFSSNWLVEWYLLTSSAQFIEESNSSINIRTCQAHGQNFAKVSQIKSRALVSFWSVSPTFPCNKHLVNHWTESKIKMTEKFCLKWNDFQSNVAKSFSKLRNEDDFFDVTLVSDDKQQVSAHKLS